MNLTDCPFYGPAMAEYFKGSLPIVDHTLASQPEPAWQKITQSQVNCFNRVAIVARPFHSSVFHFLAKLSKICEIFFSCEKKAMKLSLLHKNVNRSSHMKGNLMALTRSFQFKL